LNAIVAIVLIFLFAGAGLGSVAFVVYRRQLRRAKGIERGLKMVPIQIHLPPSSDDTTSGGRDVRDVVREKTAQAEVLYNLIAGTAQAGFKSNFYGQRHIALELIASDGLIHFYAAVPVGLVSIVEKAITTSYPGARLEEVEDHNIFNKDGRIAATMGGEIVLKADSAYPIATFKTLEADPLEALLNTLSGLQPGDGAGLQIMLRPASPGWVKRSTRLAAKRRKAGKVGMGFTAADLVKAAVKSPEADNHGKAPELTTLELAAIEAIEEKTQHVGYEVLIRVVVSTSVVTRSQTLLRDIATAFALYEAPGLNGFKFLPAIDPQGLVTAFIFRFFPPEMTTNILNSVELATLFHLPDAQFTPNSSVERQASKQVDGPVSVPTSGLLFGYNEFRGVRKEIRLSPDDRRRHTYILGQTGVGKSTLLENMAVQDMLAGNGFAFIDPHGDSAEKLLAMVPKERAEDVIYFNPSDTDYPLGLNLFEFTDPAQKDFIIQESISMLTKIYDPGKTGVIGPRFEQWFRNAALTLMSDPEGATFIEIPKVFTDTEYLKRKFRYLKDPTVIEFWTKEMGQTSDYHKSEMLGYFVSKFGAFLQNEIMRNIMGQTKSAFNLRDVMDNNKILIVNLSKGKLGELNSQLLGMMFVIKFQAAAMSRADIPEADRKDFSLYVDEFQNFSTDSFASILSEARKYHLNLIVANQFIAQLTPEIRDAVFGNIGTIVAHRMGPEDAEFMVKQFAPIFDTRDLVNIPNYHSVLRLMMGGLPSQPFTMANLPALGNVNTELGAAIKQLSAAKFGMTRSLVEAAIFERLQGKPAAAPAVASVPAPAPAATAPVAPTPVPAPAAAVAPAPVVASPPPAAPVPLTPEPAAVVSSPQIPVTDPNGLSLGDITGGVAPVAAPTPAVIDDVPLVPVVPLVAAEMPIPIAPPAVPVEPKAPDQMPVPAPVPDETIDILNDGEASAEAQHEINELLHIEDPVEEIRPEDSFALPTPTLTPAPTLTPEPVAVVGRPNHVVKHAEGRPQVSEKKLELESEPVEAAPFVGRPNHTVKHVTGRPVPLPAVAVPEEHHELIIEPIKEPPRVPDVVAEELVAETQQAVVAPLPTPTPEPTPEPAQVVDAAEYTSTAQNNIDKLMKTELIKLEQPTVAPEAKPVDNAAEAALPAVDGPVVPHLEPGEIYVDELGTVHQG